MKHHIKQISIYIYYINTFYEIVQSYCVFRETISISLRRKKLSILVDMSAKALSPPPHALKEYYEQKCILFKVYVLKPGRPEMDDYVIQKYLVVEEKYY